MTRELWRTSPVQATLVVTGTVIVAAFFFVLDLGGTVRGARTLGHLAGFAVWSGPLLLSSARSARLPDARLPWLGLAAVYVIVQPLLLQAIWRSESSTAAIGVGTIGALQWVLYGATAAVVARCWPAAPADDPGEDRSS